jgi:pilus assembly protein CpaB
VRHRTGIVALTLALVFGLLGSATAYVYLNKQTRLGADPATEVVPVVVATTDLTYATELHPENLQLAYYPEASVPEGAFSSVDSLLGQTTKVFLTAREPILAAKLTSMGGGLSLRIPKHMRATSISVTVVSGVSGFVLPGDRVDVVLVVERYGKKREAVSRTILQDIEVLAAGKKTDQKGGENVKVQSVTLLVDRDGAERLALALHEGKVHLVLRNPGDREVIDGKSLTTSEILRDPTPKPAPKRTWTPRRSTPKPPPEKKTVTVIKGVEVDEQEPPVEAAPKRTTDGTTQNRR